MICGDEGPLLARGVGRRSKLVSLEADGRLGPGKRYAGEALFAAFDSLAEERLGLHEQWSDMDQRQERRDAYKSRESWSECPCVGLLVDEVRR